MVPSFHSELIAIYYLNGGGFYVPSGKSSVVSDSIKKLVARLQVHESEPFYMLGAFRCYLYDLPQLVNAQYLIRFELHDTGIMFQSTQTSLRLPFRTYFARMLLSHLQPCAKTNRLRGWSNPPDAIYRVKHFVNPIITLFEKSLLYQVADNKGWLTRGKRHFACKVSFFVGYNLPIQFCLPAFPCKTTNPDKAASTVPDGAEYEALTTLHTFCRDVQHMYGPGAEMTIVSDGHVFSDCMGADDNVVSEYNFQVRNMSDKIAREINQQGQKSSISFRTLRGLLWPNPETIHCMDRMMEEDDAQVNMLMDNPVRTKIILMDDICRRLLVNSCAPDSQQIYDLVKRVPEHALTALYRGFSRFMFDDLAYHDDFKSRSISQRKKAAEVVALEMMRRNQAYSRLVELIYPKHIRLSIHAHDNSGPKFGIKLLPKARSSVDAVVIFSEGDRVDREQHLHIPTPWHNALVELSDNKESEVILACCKATTIRAAGYHYVKDHPRGGRFLRSPSEE